MNFIAKWWRGIEHPAHPAKIGSRRIIIGGSEPDRHWTSKFAHFAVEFYLRHWKWLWGFIVPAIIAWMLV